MDPHGILESESKLRAQKASQLARTTDVSRVIALGWPYREDSDIAIATALKMFLIQEEHLDPARIAVELCSRDTVGDAIFSRLLLEALDSQPEITIVTSDYHVSRVREIFDFVYCGLSEVEVVGVPTPYGASEQIHELESTLAFRQTFSGVNPGDIEDALKVLLSRHPFYNGVVHKRYEFQTHKACANYFTESLGQ